MASWISSQLKRAEEALESVDRTAKNLKHIRTDLDEDHARTSHGNFPPAARAPGVSQAKPSPAPPPPTTSPSAPEPTTTPAPTLQPRADSLESVDLELDSARTSAHKSVSPPAPSPSARRAAAAEPPPGDTASESAGPAFQPKGASRIAAQPPSEEAPLQTSERLKGVLPAASPVSVRTAPLAGSPSSSLAHAQSVETAPDSSTEELTGTGDRPTEADQSPVPLSVPASQSQVAEPPPVPEPPPPTKRSQRASGQDPSPAPSGEEAPTVSDAAAVAVAAVPSSPTVGPGRATDVGSELEEARLLVKGAPTVGPSKEVRLAKICEKLSQRLGEYKRENDQLEELLAAERARASGEAGELSRVEDELAQMQAELGKEAAKYQRALADKDQLLYMMEGRLEAAQKAAAAAEGRMQAYGEEAIALRAHREASERTLVAQLQQQAAEAETELAAERAAHAATHAAAEQRAAQQLAELHETSEALASQQRSLDDKIERLSESDRRLSETEAECERLQQDLKDLETKLRREQARANSLSEDSLSGQVAQLKHELQSAAAAAREAEAARDAAMAEVQRLTVEVEVTRREAAASAGRSAVDLERRFREVTDLLYEKQTQLEQLTTELAAQKLQSERQIAELKETSRMQRKQTSLSNVTSGWVDTDAGDIVPFESIGPAYERLAKNQNFGAAVRGGARLLDVSASTLGKILRQKPLFRIGIFLYIVFVHMFLWLLISRLQGRVEISETDELAAAHAAFDGSVQTPPMPLDHPNVGA